MPAGRSRAGDHDRDGRAAAAAARGRGGRSASTRAQAASSAGGHPPGEVHGGAGTAEAGHAATRAPAVAGLAGPRRRLWTSVGACGRTRAASPGAARLVSSAAFDPPPDVDERRGRAACEDVDDEDELSFDGSRGASLDEELSLRRAEASVGLEALRLSVR